LVYWFTDCLFEKKTKYRKKFGKAEREVKDEAQTALFKDSVPTAQ
jgi:hypothetical protein